MFGVCAMLRAPELHIPLVPVMQMQRSLPQGPGWAGQQRTAAPGLTQSCAANVVQRPPRGRSLLQQQHPQRPMRVSKRQQALNAKRSVLVRSNMDASQDVRISRAETLNPRFCTRSGYSSRTLLLPLCGPVCTRVSLRTLAVAHLQLAMQHFVHAYATFRVPCPETSGAMALCGCLGCMPLISQLHQHRS